MNNRVNNDIVKPILTLGNEVDSRKRVNNECYCKTIESHKYIS